MPAVAFNNRRDLFTTQLPSSEPRPPDQICAHYSPPCAIFAYSTRHPLHAHAPRHALPSWRSTMTLPGHPHPTQCRKCLTPVR